MKTKNIEIKELFSKSLHKDLGLPTGLSSLINSANFYSGATRPKKIGSMNELFTEFKSSRSPKGVTLENWTKWYNRKHPESVDQATSEICEKLLMQLNTVAPIKKLSRRTIKFVRSWVSDLIFTKTFEGLNIQSKIAKTLASMNELKYRIATKEEDAKGIDAFIGNKSISIKPVSYKTKSSLTENIEADIIVYYEKRKDGSVILK